MIFFLPPNDQESMWARRVYAFIQRRCFTKLSINDAFSLRDSSFPRSITR